MKHPWVEVSIGDVPLIYDTIHKFCESISFCPTCFFEDWDGIGMIHNEISHLSYMDINGTNIITKEMKKLHIIIYNNYEPIIDNFNPEPIKNRDMGMDNHLTSYPWDFQIDVYKNL